MKNSSFSKRIRERYNQRNLTQIKKMEQPVLTEEVRLKNFQLALSMVGVTTNLMTAELIQRIAAMVDEKGMKFSLGDAQELAAMVQAKYMAMGSPGPTMGPGASGQKFPPNMPKEVQDMINRGEMIPIPKDGLPIDNGPPMRHDDGQEK